MDGALKQEEAGNTAAGSYSLGSFTVICSSFTIILNKSSRQARPQPGENFERLPRPMDGNSHLFSHHRRPACLTKSLRNCSAQRVGNGGGLLRQWYFKFPNLEETSPSFRVSSQLGVGGGGEETIHGDSNYLKYQPGTTSRLTVRITGLRKKTQNSDNIT